MKVEKMEIIEHIALTKDVFKCVLKGRIATEITNPGQFIQIKIADKYLRRPISIADYDCEQGTLTIIYKILGEGTALLTAYEVGAELDCLGPLGNGFDVNASATATHIVLCGGGVGIPPLYSLAKTLKATYSNKKITVVAGARSATDMFYQAEFAELVDTVYVTDDGSYNPPARNVVDAIHSLQPFDYLYTCGPTGMLNALEQNFAHVNRQLSLEEQMACGVGLCMGCVYPLDDGGYIRICKEGPVLIKEGA